MAYTLAKHKEVTNKAYDGLISIDDFKTAFNEAIASKQELLDELTPFKKDDLLKMLGGMSAYTYKSEKKDRVIKAVYDDIVSFFALGSYSYVFGEDSNAGVKKKVATLTQESLVKYAEDVAKSRADYRERMLKLKKSFENPETLEEFKNFIEYKGKEKLTLEQRKQYDELIGLTTKEKQQQELEKRATIQQVDLSENVELKIYETKHTKTGADLFVVKLSERVDKETYTELNRKAKQLGGWYSSYTKDGAISGFQFKEKEQAEKFIALKEGNVSNIDKVEEKIEQKEEKRAEALRTNAEAIIERVDKELNKDILTNTSRRAAMASNVENRLAGEKSLAQTMINIANAIESGQTKFLDLVRTKAQVEQLNDIVSSAKYRMIQDKYSDEYSKYKDMAATEEVADYISDSQYLYPKLYKRNWLSAINQFGSLSGNKLVSERILKRINASKDEDYFTIRDKQDMQDIIDFADRLPENWDTKNVKEIIKNHKRLKSLGIESNEMLRAVIREFITFRSGKIEVDKVKELTRALAGRKVGFDYFPTPLEVAADMVASADIQEGMSVLEPSAGNGNIADKIKEITGISPDVIEISSELQEILKAKGYNVVAYDFLDYSEKKYDRIIMNPPFSNRMDAEHVKHAYELLKPNGRIVSIMGEGVFFGSDKKAVEFREWAESVNADIDKLPEKTFMDKTLMATTGANARLVIIDKPAEVTQEIENKEIENQNINIKTETMPTMIREPQEAKIVEELSTIQLNIQKAIAELAVPYYGISPQEALFLYNTFNGFRDKEIDCEGYLCEKELAYLIENDFIEYKDSAISNYNFSLTEKGANFLNVLQSRIDTIDSVEHGLNLFPEEANIPEISPATKADIEACKQEKIDFNKKYGKLVLEEGVEVKIDRRKSKIIAIDNEKITVEKAFGSLNSSEIEMFKYEEFLELFKDDFLEIEGYNLETDIVAFELMLSIVKNCAIIDHVAMEKITSERIAERDKQILKRELEAKEQRIKFLEKKEQNKAKLTELKSKKQAKDIEAEKQRKEAEKAEAERLALIKLEEQAKRKAAKKRTVEVVKELAESEAKAAKENEKQSYIDAIEGLKAMLEFTKGKEKKQYNDAIEGLETMLEYL